jgi:hypothetical protein
MARKSDVLSLMQSQLQLIQSGTVDTRNPYTFKTTVEKVSRTFKYEDQINDRVELCFSPSTENRQYFGHGEIWGTISVHIRGYVKSGDNFDEPDNLVEDIEYILSQFQNMRQSGIEDCRIIGIVTDEGLYKPLHVVDVRTEIKYQVDPVI